MKKLKRTRLKKKYYRLTEISKLASLYFNEPYKDNHLNLNHLNPNRATTPLKTKEANKATTYLSPHLEVQIRVLSDSAKINKMLSSTDPKEIC